jgi:predicted DNA-binding transcriptional regulator YafY
LKRLAELGAYAARAVGEAGPPEADGWSRLAFPVEAVERAALTLLGIGPEVEVLEPAELRGAVRALAAEIAGR